MQRRVARGTGITVSLLFFAWLIDYIDRLIIALALPAIGDQFHLEEAAQGAILSSFFVAYALSQVPGGILADRFGSKPVMTIAMTTWSIFTALTGTAFNYPLLLAIRFAFGICQGIFPGASLKAIAERTRPQDRLTAAGVVLASNTVGAAAAPLIAAPMIAAIGWQQAFYAISGVGILMAAILWFSLPAPTTSQQTAGPAGGYAQPAVSSVGLLRSRTLWTFALVFCGFDIVGWGLVAWVPAYLVEQRHVPLVETGLLAAIPWVAASVATVLGGMLFDRLMHDRWRMVLVPCMALTAVCLFLMLSADSTNGFVMWETAGVFCMSLANMPIFGLPLRVLPTGVAASGAALVNFGGQIGGALAPVVMGLLAQYSGFHAAFGFLLFGAGLAAAASIWSPQTQAEFEASFGSPEVSAA